MLPSKTWLLQLTRGLNPTTKSRRSPLRRLSASHLDLLEPRLLFSAVPIGGEFRVNTTTAGQQYTNSGTGQGGSVASDSAGDYVIVWHSPDGSGDGIYAQRYNAAGVAQGVEFRVNSATAGKQFNPSVAMDSDGDFVVTWSSLDGSAYGVYARRYNAAGVAQGVEFRVNSATGNEQQFSSVAMDDDGDFAVSWSSYTQDGSSWGVYAQRYNAAGAPVGGEFRVNSTMSGQQLYPTVAMDGDGDFVVCWVSNGQDGSGYGVYAQRYNAAGIPQQGEFLVNTYTSNQQRWATVAMDDSGEFVVTWTSYGQDGSSYGIYAQRYNAAGVAQESEFRVNTYTSNQQRWSSVALDADGDFVVAWSSYPQDSSGWGVFAQRYQPWNSVRFNGASLSIVGTSQDDTVAVTESPSALTVSLNGIVSVYDPTLISDIIVQGLGGSDQLALAGSVTKSAVLWGGDGNDVLTGGRGNDTLNGGTGNDRYTFNTLSSLGSDTINEVTGIDRVSLAGSPGAVTVDLSSVAAQTVNTNLTLTLDSETSIEEVEGGSGNDTLTGNSLSNTLIGRGGDDVLSGGAENDTYEFNTSTSLGSDTMTETAGIDRLSFAGSLAGITIDLGSTASQTVNANLTLTLDSATSLENIEGGSGNDTLIGNSLSNQILGKGGNDTLAGAGGDDSLDGNSGNDTYVFNTTATLGSDTVSDVAGTDKLSFAGSTDAVTADLRSVAAQVVNANLTLTLSSATSLEDVEGGSGNDTLTGNTLSNVLEGGAGNDVLIGGSGDDSYLFPTNTPLGSDTVSDSGGTDSLSFVGSVEAVSISLASTAVQTVNSNLMLTLSSPTSLENVTGGSGNDLLSGNALDNLLTGGSGDDTLTGRAGDDVLVGGLGSDNYAFNTNNQLNSDTVTDSGGIDRLNFSGSLSGVSVSLATTSTQTVNANLALTLLLAGFLEDVTGGAGADTLTGNNLANVLTGGAGNDTLSGGSGNDRLCGLAGDDLLNGGPGNDTFAFNTNSQLNSDTVTDSSGIDWLSFDGSTGSVAVSVGTTMAQTVSPNLDLTVASTSSIENVQGGAGSDTLTGSSLNNIILGGAGADILSGANGNDTLEGQAGNDSLIGGSGNDTFEFDTTMQLNSDSVTDSAGIDRLSFQDSPNAVAVNLATTAVQTVNANLKLTLASSIALENLYGGAGSDTLTGNTLANVLVGGDGGDSLNGGNGNDTLNGQAGNDSLDGGAGNDTFTFNTGAALGSDTLNDGDGMDRLDFSSCTASVIVNLASMTAQVVNSNLTLTLTSATSLENVSGGAGNDRLIGNTLNNSLAGGGGNDILNGAAGNDTLQGQVGNDTLNGGAGNDTYRFIAGTPLGSDTITDGAGTDSLSFTGTTADVTVDLGSTSTQLVNSNLMLTLTSATSLENVSGGAGNDRLIGNTLNNTLTGGPGDDVLAGGAGNDTYVFDTDVNLGTDTVNESGSGVDTLDFRNTTTQDILVDLTVTSVQVANSNLALQLSSQDDIENVSGGALNDILIGNSRTNSLTGNGGHDVLSGRGGNDTLIGGSGKNTLMGGFGADKLTGALDEDLLLGARYLLEDDTVALDAIRNEWTSASSFEDRVGHLLGTLEGGVHNGFTLTPSTVKEDSSRDTLNGGSGRDWYLRNRLSATTLWRDVVNDPNLDSVFTDIDTWL